MLDKLSRDQFVIKYGDEVVVQWNDGRRFRSEEAYKRTYWTESFVQWCVARARVLCAAFGVSFAVI
jgi:translation initiation factor 3 subunit B